jgi:hypothetical protein
MFQNEFCVPFYVSEQAIRSNNRTFDDVSACGLAANAIMRIIERSWLIVRFAPPHGPKSKVAADARNRC